LNSKELKPKYRQFHVQVLKHFLDIASSNFKSFFNYEVLINSMTAEEVDSKINFLREGAFKFVGFLIIED
jgi:hypothetical protein